MIFVFHGAGGWFHGAGGWMVLRYTLDALVSSASEVALWV